jgi:hypothetical protein
VFACSGAISKRENFYDHEESQESKKGFEESEEARSSKAVNHEVCG